LNHSKLHSHQTSFTRCSHFVFVSTCRCSAIEDVRLMPLNAGRCLRASCTSFIRYRPVVSSTYCRTLMAWLCFQQNRYLIHVTSSSVRYYSSATPAWMDTHIDTGRLLTGFVPDTWQCPSGRPRQSWLSNMLSDLSQLNHFFSKVFDRTSNGSE